MPGSIPQRERSAQKPDPVRRGSGRRGDQLPGDRVVVRDDGRARALDQPAVPGAEVVEPEQPAAIAPQHPADTAHRAVGGQQQQPAGFDRGDGPASPGSFWHEVSRPQLLQLRHDAISAGDPVVVDAVVAVPARPPPAHLHQPWPDGAGGGADGHGPGRGGQRIRHLIIARQRPRQLPGGRSPPVHAAGKQHRARHGAAEPGDRPGTRGPPHTARHPLAPRRTMAPTSSMERAPGPAGKEGPRVRTAAVTRWHRAGMPPQDRPRSRTDAPVPRAEHPDMDGQRGNRSGYQKSQLGGSRVLAVTSDRDAALPLLKSVSDLIDADSAR